MTNRNNTYNTGKYTSRIEDAETIKARFKANYINDNLARNLDVQENEDENAQNMTGQAGRYSYSKNSVAQKRYLSNNSEVAYAEPLEEEVPAKRRAVKAEEEKATNGLAGSFGFAFTAIMVACAVLFFVCLTKYITLNIQINQKTKQVTQLRNQVAKAINENDNYEMSINSKIDYNYIYNVATQELGMVYASSNQIVNYNHETGEYVVQFKDVE